MKARIGQLWADGLELMRVASGAVSMGDLAWETENWLMVSRKRQST